MKNRVLTKDLTENIGQEVDLGVIVSVARQQGKMAFFDFRDRSGVIQGVVFGKPEVLEVAKTLSPEFSIKVSGVINERPEKMVNANVQNGNIELEITNIEVLNTSAPMPFDMEAELNIDTYLDNLPLTLLKDSMIVACTLRISCPA